MTLPELTAALETELSRPRTTRFTWALVRKFWSLDIDLGATAQQIYDRVALIEARMAQQHGWAR